MDNIYMLQNLPIKHFIYFKVTSMLWSGASPDYKLFLWTRGEAWD